MYDNFEMLPPLHRALGRTKRWGGGTGLGWTGKGNLLPNLRTTQRDQDPNQSSVFCLLSSVSLHLSTVVCLFDINCHLSAVIMRQLFLKGLS